MYLRSFAISLVSLLCFFVGRLDFIFAPLVRAVQEAFPRPDASLAVRAAIEAASPRMPASVSSYVDRRLARQPSRRRGPWGDLNAGLPLAA